MKQKKELTEKQKEEIAIKKEQAFLDEMIKKIIRDKAEKRTQRILKALLNDEKAMAVLAATANDDFFSLSETVEFITNRINIYLK